MEQRNNKLIILDRDGVINYESLEYVKTPDEWIPIPGSLNAIAALSKAGYTIVIATNQSGIARGYYSTEMLSCIHDKMCDAAAEAGGHIHRIYYCPHAPEDDCFCRKPKPGLLQAIARDYSDIFADACFVGDNFTDIQVAQTVGCQPILVKTGHGADTWRNYSEKLTTVPVFEDLNHFAESILVAME